MGEIVVDLKLDFVSEADRSRFSSAIESFGHVLRVDGRRATIWRLFGRAIARLVEAGGLSAGRANFAPSEHTKPVARRSHTARGAPGHAERLKRAATGPRAVTHSSKGKAGPSFLEMRSRIQ